MIPGEDERVDVTEGLHQQLNTAMANLPGATRSAINNVVYHLVSYICRTPWCLPGGFWLASSTQHMSVPGVFRCAPSACALAFGVPKFSASCVFQRGIRVCHPARPAVAVDRRAACNFQTRQARSMCVWAAATEATPQVDETSAADSVKEFEDELDAIAAGVDDEEAPLEEPSSPRRLSLLESNVKILEQDCKVAQLFVDAATSRKNSLYLGLDISTQSTGYAVLRPSTATMGTPVDSSHNDLFFGSGNSHRDEPALLRDVGEANLVEWGYISGTGSDGKKGDEVDVGVIVEETLMQVAARCGRSTGDDASEPSSPPSTGSSEQEGKEQAKVGTEGQVWVVGVEDFMRRFLPGRSNSKSIFALAQLNGIVKYACHKHLGTKANSYHPSTPRSFYGLTKNKPEGKDMKQIVHDFALSQENGALDSRYEWPVSPDGSKADASFDITDAYLIARYSWHRDVFRAVADDTAAKERFAESFRSLHSDKLQTAEERSIEMFVKGDMPALKGKRKLKPMTERSARNAHRKLQDARFTKAYESALMEWFQQRILGKGS